MLHTVQHSCNILKPVQCTGLSLVPSAVATVGRIVSTIFVNAMATPPIFMSFGTLIPNLTSKFRIRRKIDRTGHLIFFSNDNGGIKNSKFDNFNQKRSYRLEMTRGVHIWAPNLNRTAFDPLLGQKSVENGILPPLIVFWPKRCSNVVWFNFWDQIWNPLVLSSLYDLFLLKLSNFELLVPHCNAKNFKWPVRSIFLGFEFFDVRFGISVQKDIKLGSVAIALPEKKWWSQPGLPYQQH